MPRLLVVLMALAFAAAALSCRHGSRPSGWSGSDDSPLRSRLPDLAERGEAHLSTLNDAANRAAHESYPPSTPVTGREKARARMDHAAGYVGWIANICALAAIGTLIASFFLPIIPRRASMMCLLGAGVGWVVQYMLYVYGVLVAEVAIWGTVVFGLAAAVLIGYPWFAALRTHRKRKQTKP